MFERLHWKGRWFILNRFPFILNFLRFIPSLRHTVVTRRTDLLIEGFPRSGNTFARNAFLFACNKGFNTTSHLHLISSVRKAVRLQKPVLILVRKPEDAICSYLVYRGESFPVQQAIREYIDFYDYILGIKDRVVIASFDEVTESFDSVINRVNQRFGTKFPLFEHPKENVKHCMESTRQQVSPWLADRGKWSDVRKRSAPANGRSALKQSAMERLSEERCREMMARADLLYCKLTDHGV